MKIPKVHLVVSFLPFIPNWKTLLEEEDVACGTCHHPRPCHWKCGLMRTEKAPVSRIKWRVFLQNWAKKLPSCLLHLPKENKNHQYPNNSISHKKPLDASPRKCVGFLPSLLGHSFYVSSNCGMHEIRPWPIWKSLPWRFWNGFGCKKWNPTMHPNASFDS